MQFDVARVQGAAQIAEEAQPVGGVAVTFCLVDLAAAAVPLGLVHRHVGAAQQVLGVQGVVGEDGDAGAGLQDEGQPVEVERRAEFADEPAGRALGAGGGVGDGQQDGELVAAEAGGLGTGRQGELEPLGDLQQQPVAREVAEGVVDGAEAVEVDQDQRGAGADALGVVQRGPGALQQPLTVGQAGERVAQLLLGAGAGDPQGGVEGDQRNGEEREEDGHLDGDHADQRGDAEQGDADERLPDEGRPGCAGQAVGAGARQYQRRTRVTRR